MYVKLCSYLMLICFQKVCTYNIENFKKEAAYMLHFSVRLTANLQ